MIVGELVLDYRPLTAHFTFSLGTRFRNCILHVVCCDSDSKCQLRSKNESGADPGNYIRGSYTAKMVVHMYIYYES